MTRRTVIGSICTIVLVFGFLASGLIRYLLLDEPLYHAAQERDLTKMRRLLSWGADPNADYDGFYTVLMAAAGQKDFTEGVKLLLDSGADPDLIINGKTAYYYASSDEVRKLLRAASERKLLNK